MKKNNFFVLLIILLAFISCEDFLEVDKVGETSIPVFFSDMDGIRGAVPGAYSAIYKFYDSEFYLYPDAASDLVNINPTGSETKMISQFNFQSEPDQESSAVGHIWLNGFKAIANLNNILEYHPKLLKEFPESENELDQIKAQALFLRGLMNFDLVRVYAQPFNFTDRADHIGIPIILKSPGPDKNAARETVDDVYVQILEDLEASLDIFEIQNLENISNSYFASKTAVEALLSRVHLFMGNWGEAAQYSDEVMRKTSLAKRDDYIDMFRTRTEGEEAIFRLDGKLKSSAVGKFYALSGTVGYASDKLFDLFEGDSTDIRLDLFEREGANFKTLKYSRPEVSDSEYGQDLFVLRTSEIVLINAEANVKLNDFEKAKDGIKAIQSRAFGIEKDSIVLQENSEAQLLDLIEKERMKELSFEGHRLFDLTRNQKGLERDDKSNSTIKKLQFPNHLFILPIPLGEINANENMIQNEGYE